MEKTDKPDVWVGHVVLKVNDLDAAINLCKVAGMRFVTRIKEKIGILELRAGTHLLLMLADDIAKDQYLDLMVEDLEAMRVRLLEAGYSPTEIKKNSNGVHNIFEINNFAGTKIIFYDSHVVGVV